MIETYMVMYAIDIIALVFLFGLLQGERFSRNNRKRSFSYGIGFTVLAIFSEFVTIVAGDNELRILNILFNVIGFAITPIIPIVLIAIFDVKTIKLNKLALLPSILNGIASVLSPWLGLIFYVDLNNNYERGSFFNFFVAVYVINILLLVAETVQVGQKYLYPIKNRIIGLSVFILAGTCVQLLYPEIYLSWHIVTLTLFILYILLLEFEGSFDTVTELYNRAAFERASKQLKEKQMFSVVVMDINNFKEMNDTYGHEYGDTVLKKVATIINESFENKCTCYRIGGDEFSVIIRDIDQEKLEKQLRHMTNELTKTRGEDACLPMVAYGYSFFYADEPLDFQKIFMVADKQMYYHKNLKEKNDIYNNNKPDDEN